MAKVKLNPGLTSLAGELGGWVRCLPPLPPPLSDESECPRSHFAALRYVQKKSHFREYSSQLVS